MWETICVEVEKPDIYYVSSQPANIISVTELNPEPNMSFLKSKNYLFCIYFNFVLPVVHMCAHFALPFRLRDKGKVKVKVTLVQALRICTGPTAHRRSRGIALLFLDHGTRRGEWSASRPGRNLP